MDFADAFEDKLSQPAALVREVRELTNSCGKHLADVAKMDKGQHNQFLTTALQFTRINYDATNCIHSTIKAGHLSETFVLLRWHLELVQLYYYLWKNEAEYQLWLGGKEIRPKTIGIFLESNELANWKDTYIDWSNVTHGNSQYVENCWKISNTSPRTDELVILGGHALRNLMFNGHRINMVSGTLLKSLIDVRLYNPIVERYNSLEKQIFAYSDQQNKMENDAWSD